MKRIGIWFILILCLFVCASCTTLSEDELAVQTVTDSYVNAWRNGDYETMYNTLSSDSRREISLEDFSAFYAEVSDALDLQLITVTSASFSYLNDLQYTRNLTVTYLSEKVGRLTYELVIPVTYSASHTWLIDWSPSLFIPDMELGDTIRYTPLYAKRGEIFDSQGKLLAQNAYADAVVLNLLTCTDVEGTLARLAVILDEPVDDLISITQKAQGNGEEVAILKSYLPSSMPDATRSQLSAEPDIYIDDSTFCPIRYYPYGQYASHLLGYVGAITAEELASSEYAGYKSTDLVGKTGLEASYESTLHGTDGARLSIVKPSGARRKILWEKPAVNGKDITLTINIDYQARVEQIILGQLGEGQTGAAIVLNPKTGALYSAVSFPGYNNNLFSRPISEEEWAYYQDEANGTPLLNRFTRGLFAPGSTMKPFVAAWSLESNVLTTADVFPYQITEDGYWHPRTMYPNWTYHRIKRYTMGYGELNMYRGLVWSDNIYFAWAALKLGGEAFYSYSDRLGFSQPIDFDLPVTAPQLTGERDLRTDLGLLADSGYGQGEMLTSPLQMSALFSAFANNGTIMTPYSVASVNDTVNGAHVPVSVTQPAVWRSNVLTASSISQLSPILNDVISVGSGYNARIEGVTLAGKTGTAQVSAGREHAWIILYVNDGSCDLLVCVMLDTPADKGAPRIRMARDITKAYLNDYKNAN